MLFLIAHTVHAAQAGIPAEWNLNQGATHRWVVQSEMVFPGHLMLKKERNGDVRARAITTQFVLSCTAEAPSPSKGFLSCLIEDASFGGATFPSEQGRLQPVLEEMAYKLTHAKVSIVIKNNGHIQSVKLKARQVHPSRNFRTRQIENTLRNLVRAGIAPLDVEIPAGGFQESGWPQYNALLLTFPTDHGTKGGGTLIHHAQRLESGLVMISSAGRANLSDAVLDQGGPVFSVVCSGHSVFDVVQGRVSEAKWEAYGTPTASSGVMVRDYSTRITISAIDPDTPIKLNPIEEWRVGWNGPLTAGDR